MAHAGGRPPIPAAVKALTGRRPGQDTGGRRIRGNPEPAARPPVRPDFVEAYARLVWDEVVKSWAQSGLLWELDSQQLGIYCILQARARELILAGQRLPNELMTWLVKYAGMFGLSPADRGRLGSGEQPAEVDPLEAMRLRRMAG